jgi:hypothetical protein
MIWSVVYLALWFSVAVPTLVGAVYFKRLKKSLRIITILMAMGLLAEMGLRFVGHKNNLFVVHIYTFFEILLLTLYFGRVITTKRKLLLVRILGSTLLVLTVLEIMLVGVREWNSFSTVAESITMITFGLFYFHEIALAITTTPLDQNPDFWVTSVILLYFMGSLEYFMLSRYLSSASPKSLTMLWHIHNIINAFCNLAYAVILWRFTRSYSLAR